MRVIQIASEAVPFAKTGGLADVVGALPRELEAQGHRVTTILPFHRSVSACALPVERMNIKGVVSLGQEAAEFNVWRCSSQGSGEVYFVDHDGFFASRSEIYGGAHSYSDNDWRFIMFSKASLEIMRMLDLEADVIHTHDWQTGAVPLLMRSEADMEDRFRRAASIHTIHNLAYQGVFPPGSFALLNLPPAMFRPDGIEFHGNTSLLKAGLVYADMLTTVSPTYAEEIQGEMFGEGLEGVLRSRSKDLVGILNGIDTKVWDPSGDSWIETSFSAEKPEGKALCKKALVKELGLVEGDRWLVGVVSRLAGQKGLDELPGALSRLLEEGRLSVAILGTGDPELGSFFRSMANHFPHSMSFTELFDEGLAHRIEAGSDAFLMPSRYEPCGLNQLISMRYGTLPLVTQVGGLKDSVTPFQVDPKSANGFSIKSPQSSDIEGALRLALDVYENSEPTWKAMMLRAMKTDVSWSMSASRYVSVYEQARGNRAQFIA